MKDPRSLYMNQLINCYRKSFVESTTTSSTMNYTLGYFVNYRCEGDNESTYLYFNHNEGLDCIQRYIKYLEKNIQDLEKKVDELQHIERIIQETRRTNYGDNNNI